MRQRVFSPSEEAAIPIPATMVAVWHGARFLCCGLILVMLSGAAHAKPTPKPTSTTVPTRTPITEVANPTPTPISNVARCRLPVTGSEDVATLTITNANDGAQSYDLVSPSPNGHDRIDFRFFTDTSGQGEHALECHVHNIDPVFIHYISGTTIFSGWLCVTPSASACSRTGTIDCNGGDALGFDALADSNIGHCGGNAGCKNKCETFCQNEARKFYGSHCALPQNRCECRCISRNAGFPGEPGTAQCYLGARVTIEAALPCGDGDALVDFGNRCFPMTTNLTTAVIKHADFSQSQIGPIEETGTPIQCHQLSSNMTGGLVTDGQVPIIFNPPSSQDVILTLHLPCALTPTPTPTPTPKPTSTPPPTRTATPTRTRTPTTTLTPSTPPPTRTTTPTSSTPTRTPTRTGTSTRTPTPKGGTSSQ